MHDSLTPLLLPSPPSIYLIFWRYFCFLFQARRTTFHMNYLSSLLPLSSLSTQHAYLRPLNLFSVLFSSVTVYLDFVFSLLYQVFHTHFFIFLLSSPYFSCPSFPTSHRYSAAGWRRGRSERRRQQQQHLRASVSLGRDATLCFSCNQRKRETVKQTRKKKLIDVVSSFRGSSVKSVCAGKQARRCQSSYIMTTTQRVCD